MRIITFIILIFFLKLDHALGQLLEFKLISDKISFSNHYPFKLSSNDDSLKMLVWDYNTKSYLVQSSDKIEYISFEQGKGECELQVNDFYVVENNHLIIYDPSLAKLLIYNLITKKCKEMEIDNSYNRIFLSKDNKSANHINFFLFSIPTGALSSYSYKIDEQIISNLENLDTGINLENKNLSDGNVFNLVNDVYTMDENNIIFINHYEPFYFIYNLTNKVCSKYKIYDYERIPLKKDGKYLKSPKSLLKSSIVHNNYLYCIYYPNRFNDKDDETIIRINLNTNSINEIIFMYKINTFIINATNPFPEFIADNNKLFQITKSIEK